MVSQGSSPSLKTMIPPKTTTSYTERRTVTVLEPVSTKVEETAVVTKTATTTTATEEQKNKKTPLNDSIAAALGNQYSQIRQQNTTESKSNSISAKNLMTSSSSQQVVTTKRTAAAVQRTNTVDSSSAGGGLQTSYTVSGNFITSSAQMKKGNEEKEQSIEPNSPERTVGYRRSKSIRRQQSASKYETMTFGDSPQHEKK